MDMKDEFDQNFERQAFFSQVWQRRKSPIRDKGRAILTDTGRLRSSIHSRITSNSVIFYTDLPYVAIHNDGGEFIVTQRMKRFFRAKAYEAAGSFGRKKNSNTTQKNILRSATDSSTHGCTQPSLHPKPNSGAHFP